MSIFTTRTSAAMTSAISRGMWVVAAGMLGSVLMLQADGIVNTNETLQPRIVPVAYVMNGSFEMKLDHVMADQNPDLAVKAAALARVINYHLDHHQSALAQATIREYFPIAKNDPGGGQTVGRIIDFSIEEKDFASADAWLAFCFREYDGGKWLDTLLLKWVMVKYRMRHYQESLDKCEELIFQYSDSSAAQIAKTLIPKIKAKLPTATTAPVT